MPAEVSRLRHPDVDDFAAEGVAEGLARKPIQVTCRQTNFVHAIHYTKPMPFTMHFSRSRAQEIRALY